MIDNMVIFVQGIPFHLRDKSQRTGCLRANLMQKTKGGWTTNLQLDSKEIGAMSHEKSIF